MGLKLKSTGGTGSVELNAPANHNIDTSFTLPTSNFTGGEFVLADGSGNVNIDSGDIKLSTDVGGTTPKYSIDWTGVGAGQVAVFSANTLTGEVRMGADNASGTYFTTLYSNGSESVRIDSSGNVGIGTTSIDERVHVEGGNANERIKIENTTTGIAGLVMLNTNRRYDVQVNGSDLQFYDNTGGSTRMRITQEGYIRFNTTGDPSVSGNNGAQIGFQGQNFWRSRTSSSTSYGHMVFYNPNGGVGNITTNGSATAYNTSSDYRLKENVTPVTDGITRLQQLKPSRFNFIADPDKTVDGFLAHEAQTVVPEAVTGTKDEVDDEGNAVMQGIDQSKLVPLLTAALQEAIAKIETLETKVAALEGGTTP